MKNVLYATAALTSFATMASAGGLDRSGQQVRVLFEEGNRVEASFAVVSPDLSGTLGGVGSGDAAGTDLIGGFGYKRDINDRLSFAVIVDNPYGAVVDYPTGTGYAFAGSTANVNSTAITALLRYKFGEFSVYGGPRGQSIVSEAFVPPAAGYTLDGDQTFGIGYTVGAAYEKPEIALRAALTYHSGIDHDQDVTETSLLGTTDTTINFRTPQAINLDLQTGIAENTLLFGSVRWVDWSDFEVAPPVFSAIVGGTDNSLLRFQDDRVTYTIGVGRRFNENWSGALTAEYEPNLDEITTDLGPIDGRSGVGVAVTYRNAGFDVTGGLRYTWIGDATSRSGAVFTDNTALSFGLRIGMKI